MFLLTMDLYIILFTFAVIYGVYRYYQKQASNEKLLKDASKSPFHTVIIGAGVSGIACGHTLQKKNIKYTILEKNDRLGGTWLTNKFPGVRFDSLHIQTLYSFEPIDCPPMCNGARFLQYLEDVARKYGIYEHIKFSEPAESINFDTSTKMWTVVTPKGTYEANFVINANGYYDPENPNTPECFQKTPFKGKLLHSFKIDQEKEDFTGQDIVLVGSGATASTMIPELAKTAKSVTMVQRSPSYVIQSDYGQYPGYPSVVKLWQKGYTLPWKIYRLYMCVILHGSVMTMVHYLPKSVFSWIHNFQLKYFSKLDDQAVAEHFTPKYNFGEQRPLVSLGFVEALQKVKVITSAVTGLNETSVITASGEKVPCDTVIMATGFNLEYFKFKVFIDGKEVDMYDQVLRKDMWFEGIPNFVNMVLYARLDSKNYTCFTPLVEHAVDLISDVINNMRARGLTTVCIRPFAPDQKPTEIYYPMSSTYFHRNKDKCFKANAEEASSLGRVWRIPFGYSYHESDWVYTR